jgi:hypothetical protein
LKLKIHYFKLNLQLKNPEELSFLAAQAQEPTNVVAAERASTEVGSSASERRSPNVRSPKPKSPVTGKKEKNVDKIQQAVAVVGTVSNKKGKKSPEEEKHRMYL